MIEFSRDWAMPNKFTFDIKPIKEFVDRYVKEATVSVDPFAANKKFATYSNDINPKYEQEFNMDALEFLEKMDEMGVRADLIILDMPYSPRQISECYQEIGRKVTMSDTQSAKTYRLVRDAVMKILAYDAVVLSFGWNTVGMGKGRGFQIKEIKLVCGGGAHNDTICMAEKWNVTDIRKSWTDANLEGNEFRNIPELVKSVI